MADHEHQSGNVESTDRGFFDFMKKKNEDEKKNQEEVISTEFQQKVEVSKEEDNKHGSLLDKLHHHSDSSDSSSSDEEGDDEEKKRRRKERKEQKKSLKEKLKEKLPGHKDKLDDDKEDKKKDHHLHEKEDTNVPIEKIHMEEVVYSEPSHPAPAPPPPHHYEAAEGDKKGLLEKIKDKLPGQHKKPEGEHHDVGYVAPAPAPAPAHAPTASVTAEVEGQEKKGFLDKIKEKIPGFHPKAPEEEKKDHVEKRDSEFISVYLYCIVCMLNKLGTLIDR